MTLASFSCLSQACEEGIISIKRTITEVEVDMYTNAVAIALSHQFQPISPSIHSAKPCVP